MLFAYQCKANSHDHFQNHYFLLSKTGDELPKEDIISSYAVHSQLECSHRCLQTSSCVGFNFRPKSNKYAVNCQLSNKNRARNEMTNEVKREWTFYYSLTEVYNEHKD